MSPSTLDCVQFIRHVDTVTGDWLQSSQYKSVKISGDLHCMWRGREVIAWWLQVARDGSGHRWIRGRDMTHTLRHGQQGAAENWGGMTSLPGRMRECKGGEGVCCALFSVIGTGTTAALWRMAREGTRKIAFSTLMIGVSYPLSYKFTYSLCVPINWADSVISYFISQTVSYFRVTLYVLTPRLTVRLEELTVSHLTKKFSSFYETRRFITVFTTSHDLFLSWARLIQFLPSYFFKILVMFSSYLRFGLPGGLFGAVCATKTLSLSLCMYVYILSDTSHVFHLSHLCIPAQCIVLLNGGCAKPLGTLHP